MGFAFTGSTYVVASQTSTETIMGNLVAGDLTASNSYIRMLSAFKITTPPSSRSFSFVFTSLYLKDGVYYPIDTASYAVTPLAGVLTSVAVTGDSYSVNDVTTYYVSFTTTNKLTTGSYIGVEFPVSLVLGNASSCSANVSAISACSITNSSFANLSLSGNLVGGSAVKVTFHGVVNPGEAQTTASIKVKTYYDNLLDSVVDKITSGLTVVIVARVFTNVSVTPLSLVTYALDSYQFSVVLLDPIPAGGTIVVTFPSPISLGSVGLVSATFSSAFCSVVPSSLIVTLSGCFPSGLVSGAYSFSLSNIYNPPSLEATSSISLLTAGAAGTVNFINSGLAVTMTTPATTTSFAVTPTSSVVHATTTYTLIFTFAVPHQSGDYFKFVIDPSMAFSGPSCNPVSGVASLSCVASNASTVVVTFTSIPQSTASISITSIRNFDISGSVISFSVAFFSAANYPM